MKTRKSVKVTCPKCMTSFSGLRDLEDHRLDDESECFMFQNETVYEGNTAAKPQHTPTPWINPKEAPTLISSVSHGMVAQCNADDAAFIVRAVNSHEKDQEIKKELLEMTRSLVDRLDDGTALKARAQAIIAKAEGK